jgi:type III restriction enzyme
MAGTIDQLIVNGPYDEPTQHWTYDRESRTFSLVPGRRAAGYVVATPGSKSFDDPGVFRPLPLVSRIRPRVKAWREAGYPGVTGTTLRLLHHWRDPEVFEERRFFFTFLPHEGGDDVVPPPPAPKSRIEALPERRALEIAWPNVLRVEHTWVPRLSLDWTKVAVLRLDASETATLAELAPVVEGKPDVSRIAEIDLDDLARRFRLQTIAFATARDVFDQMAPTWTGGRQALIAQLVPLIEVFLASDRLAISPALFGDDSRRRRILLTLNMNRIVRHLWEAIRHENTEALVPVFDGERPIRGTGDMLPWYTGRPWAATERSHVNRCVFDSAWEASEAFHLDRLPDVATWVKNDHLGFEIVYVFDGVVRKYRPDFLVRLTAGTMLVLEVKGQDSPQNQAKRAALDEWARAVTQHGGFGRWVWGVSRAPSDVADVIHAACRGGNAGDALGADATRPPALR